jgi:hypothetical protein
MDGDFTVFEFFQAGYLAAGLYLGAESLGLILHLFDKARPVDALDAGIVFYSVGIVDLSTRHEFLKNQGLEPVAGGIKSRSQPRRSGANYNAIIIF